VRAHFAFYGMFTELYRERVKRKQEPFKNMKGLYSKSIIWAYFAQKKRKFSDLF